MSVIGGASQGGAIDTGDIGHSLRFRASNSAYLTRAFSASPNTYTFFFCFKRGSLGVEQMIACSRVTAGSASYIEFTTADKLRVHLGGSFVMETAAVYRDPTAWLFGILRVTQSGTAILEVNGSAVASASVGSQPWLFNASAGYVNSIGRYGDSSTFLYDGYLARCGYIEGSSIPSTDLGYQNIETNAWVTKSQAAVKTVVDTGGTNSFMLDFDDGTSLTTLGYDKSSKGNNWTLNNFSLTAGATYDWMEDTPSNNFPTLNILDPYVAGITVSEANLSATYGNDANHNIYGFPLPTTGKLYLEVIQTGGPPTDLTMGFVRQTFVGDGSLATDSSYMGYTYAGRKWYSGSPTDGGTTLTVGTDVMRFALDFDAGKAWVGKPSAWFGSGDPAAGTSPFFTFTANSAMKFAAVIYHASFSLNHGQRPFSGTAPAGFETYCTANLPEVTGAALNPKRYFDVVLDTGANIKAAVEALFADQALMVVKDRANANNWQWFNDVTGLSAILQSNTQVAETTYTAPSGSSVGYGFKAGTSAVTNNAGSITSQVSANVEAGFSIVTYTGTGANATVGHGLSKTPAMVIVKGRTTGSQNWIVWVNGFLGTDYLVLNGTNAKIGATPSVWNSTVPSSSVFSIGTSPATNNSGADTYIAYCFAEVPGYSKIGSYVGNGSADGPFVFCGFRPRWVMIKRTDAANSWTILDTSRAPINVATAYLLADSSQAEFTSVSIDLTANGFKLRDALAWGNASGGTYIFMAIAETTMKFSTAR